MQIHHLIVVVPFILGSASPGSLPAAAKAPPKAPISHIAPLPDIPVPVMATFQPLEPVVPPPPPSLPVAPQGTYANTYAFGNCTWYVAGRKQVPQSWGNAATWAGRAAAQGITVSATPMIGSIAQRIGGLGHVAIVLEISGDQVKITEMNSAGFDTVDERWEPTSTYNYIYL